MVLTGWDTATLRRQPARVIRALFHRVFAAQVWHPEITALAHRKLPHNASLDDRIAKGSAVEMLAWAEAYLFPADA